MKLKTLLLLLFSAPLFAQTATINGGTTYQTMDGWGGQDYQNASAMNPAATSFFFGTSTGTVNGTTYPSLGLQIIRTSNYFNGTIYDLTSLQNATALGAKVELGLQSPPCSLKHSYVDLGESCTSTSDHGWIQPPAFNDGTPGSSGTCFANGLSLTGSGGAYDQYGNYIVSTIQNFVANGITITYLDVQNEANITSSNLGACIWSSGSQFQTFIRDYLGPKLTAAGLSGVKLILGPAYNWSGTDFVSACLNDSSCAPYVYMSGGHGYGYPFPPTIPPSVWRNKPMGLTETAEQGTTQDQGIGGALTWANNIYGWLTQTSGGNNYGLSMFQWWELAYPFATANGCSNCGLNDGAGSTGTLVSGQPLTPATRAFAEGNFSRFVRAGWQRIGVTGGASGVNIVAFKDPASASFAVVAINNNGSSTSQTFSLSSLSASSVTPYITSSSLNLAAQPTVTVSGSAFTYSLPAQSVSSFVASGGGGSGIINAATCSQSDVQAALAMVSAPTTVVNIPAGVCSWTGQTVFTVPSSVTSFTIQGQTVMNCTGTPGTASYACAATDNTVIKDGVTSGSNNSPLVIRASGQTALLRLTGLSLFGGAGTVKNDGPFVFYGPTHALRIDHTHFNVGAYTTSFSTFTGRMFGDLEGVLDHDIWDNWRTVGGDTVSQGFAFSNNINDSIGYGDGPWNQPAGFGGLGAIYIEDSIINGGEVEDCDTGGRFVVRYSTINGGSTSSATIHSHGTKTESGRGRSCRDYEAYHNYIVGPTSPQFAAMGNAGGPALVWGNDTVSGWNNLAAVGTSRNDGSETETNTPNGWGYCGTLVRSNGVGSAWDGNSPATTGYPCLDGVGRSEGQALNGQNFPNAKNTSTSSIAWPNEYLFPMYFFCNTGQTNVVFSASSNALAFNRDVFTDNASFNGTTGTGCGLLSARPNTCTAGAGGSFAISPTGSYGVLYFATDNQTGYVCDATNHWTPIYSPLVHPHPLAGGTPNAATPSFSPSGGTYSSSQSVAITSTTPANTIYFTVDGTTPTTLSPVYSSPVVVSSNTTIQAIATASGFFQSPVGSAAYIFSTPTCGNPTQLSPFSGPYSAPLTVNWNNPTSACTLYYTDNGSDPTTSSAIWPSGGIPITVTTTFRVVARAPGYINSGVYGGEWTITMPTVATPSFSPVAGAYTSTQSVSMSSTAGATICYTNDESTPIPNGPSSCTHGTVYSAAVSVSSSQTLKAIGSKPGYTDSPVESASYLINSIAPPTISGVVSKSGTHVLQ